MKDGAGPLVPSALGRNPDHGWRLSATAPDGGPVVYVAGCSCSWSRETLHRAQARAMLARHLGPHVRG